MPDNWSFVVAAYLLTALVLALYWRSLDRRERASLPRLPSRAAMDGLASRARAHPRPDPTSPASPPPSRP